MEVKSFKLITGEEIVARVNETKRATVDSGPFLYVIESPQVLQFQQVAKGQLGLAFVPWTLSNVDGASVQLPASAVVLCFQPSAQVEKQYLQQTSKIDLA